jgi:hypothetical protein
MKLFPAAAGAVMVLLLAGAAASATQVSPEAPGLLGAIAHWFACGDPNEAALLARDALDEVEFNAMLEAVVEAGE